MPDPTTPRDPTVDKILGLIERYALRRISANVAGTKSTGQWAEEYRAEADATLRQIGALLAALAEAQRERDELRQHILDIDAHATPYGDIPDEPGWVGTYLLTAGALHRALGKIGHSAPKCQAEHDLKLMQQAVEEYRESWRAATQATLAECERLHADLAAAQCREELMRPVVEAVRSFRTSRLTPAGQLSIGKTVQGAIHALDAAWDTYETQTGGTE